MKSVEAGTQEHRTVSVVIPARNEGNGIASVVAAVSGQMNVDASIEVIVVDDGSFDDTAQRAQAAGAFVIRSADGMEGNPARARNVGARHSCGDPVVFLDADCVPGSAWLAALLAAHSNGAVIVGGALDLPPGLSLMARCDYYCGSYFTHSLRPAAWVPHHPPNNISVRRGAFFSTAGFAERAPLSYTNEERYWQAELRRAGEAIFFQPQAAVLHYNRPGFGNLLRRSYRWGYTALEAKAETEANRARWLFGRPKLVIAVAPILPFAFTAHIVATWLRAGSFEPALMTPIILVSRMAYVAGMVIGGLRWLRARGSASRADRPSPRWQ